MPETKGKSLEEIDFVFRKSTGELIRENVLSTRRTIGKLVTFKWREIVETEPEVASTAEKSSSA